MWVHLKALVLGAAAILFGSVPTVMAQEPEGLARAKELVSTAIEAPGIRQRVRLLRDAIAAFPDADVPHFLLGVELHVLGDVERAEKEFAEAIDINPKHYRAKFNLGQIQMERLRYKEAAVLFGEALEVAKASGASAEELSAIEGKLESARYLVQVYQRALSRFDDVVATIKSGSTSIPVDPAGSSTVSETSTNPGWLVDGLFEAAEGIKRIALAMPPSTGGHASSIRTLYGLTGILMPRLMGVEDPAAIRDEDTRVLLVLMLDALHLHRAELRESLSC